MPSITYEVENRKHERIVVYSPHLFPDDGTVTAVYEPWIKVAIITPEQYVGMLMPFLYDHEATVEAINQFGDDRVKLDAVMPLRELMRGFFDGLKSITSGYASISYEQGEMKAADVVRMDIIIGDELQPAFTRIMARRRVVEDGEEFVERLEKLMPRQQVEMKIQAKALGRIIASRTLKAFRKDVTQHMYGGDYSRKLKLLDKQKKGKKKMRENANVNIPHDIFIKVMKQGD